jgi:hypothetical protein
VWVLHATTPNVTFAECMLVIISLTDSSCNRMHILAIPSALMQPQWPQGARDHTEQCGMRRIDHSVVLSESRVSSYTAMLLTTDWNSNSSSHESDVCVNT